MCDDCEERTFTLDVPYSGLPVDLQENAHRARVVAAAKEALKLMETGSPGLAERTLRLALYGGHPKTT